MSKRNAVQYIQQAEPSFIKKFKQQAGFKEEPSIEDKFKEDVAEENNLDPAGDQDESPTIVVLKPGDLSAEDVHKIEQFSSLSRDVGKERDSTAAVDRVKADVSTYVDQHGKPKFVKPIPGSQPDTASKKTKLTSQMQPVKNSCLLSFNEDEDSDSSD